MSPSFIISQLANYGFPMVLSWYLLLRIEKKLQILTKSIDGLHDLLANAKVKF